MSREAAMEYLRGFMRDFARDIREAFKALARKLQEIARALTELVKAHTRLDATLAMYEDWGGVLWSSPESFNDTVTRMTRRQL